jgi:two-component system phosphate regulon sensor histidine kinase PhoR
MEDSPKLMISKVDIKKICENVVKIFEQKVKPENIGLNLNIEEDSPKLSVDIFRFEQILVNLIDNAIKYTDEGGITINIFQEFDKAIIEVEDTGVGISKEDQLRIFERFYITDKSRSRKTGGSGLGLSIVKHIVQLHEGSINIESEKGKGTKFIIQLPLESNVSTK